MDQRPDQHARSRAVAAVDRIWSRLWPVAMIIVALVVAACGKGGGGAGY